jgi:hypothetical protein
MVKGTCGNEYFNVKTGAVVKPIFDYDELGVDYLHRVDACYPVYNMRHHYVGYIQNNVFIVPWENQESHD